MITLTFLTACWLAGLAVYVTDRRWPGLLSNTVVAFGAAITLGAATGWVIGAFA